MLIPQVAMVLAMFVGSIEDASIALKPLSTGAMSKMGGIQTAAADALRRRNRRQSRSCRMALDHRSSASWQWGP
jgi:hypothetical protein